MYLKNFALDFVILVLKLYPIQVVISLPLWVKLTMGQLLLLFLYNFCSFFRYVGGVPVTNLFSPLLIDIFWLFSKLYNTQGALLIIFFICSDLLNCLRSVSTIVITTESGSTSFKVIFTKQFLKFKRKYQRNGPCFQTIFPFLTTMINRLYIIS